MAMLIVPGVGALANVLYAMEVGGTILYIPKNRLFALLVKEGKYVSFVRELGKPIDELDRRLFVLYRYHFEGISFIYVIPASHSDDVVLSRDAYCIGFSIFGYLFYNIQIKYLFIYNYAKILFFFSIGTFSKFHIGLGRSNLMLQIFVQCNK